MWIAHTIDLGTLALADGRVITAELEVDLHDGVFLETNLQLDEQPAELTDEIEDALQGYVSMRLNDWRRENEYPATYRLCRYTGAYEPIR